MPSNPKTPAPSKEKDRRKSGGNKSSSTLITLRLDPLKLRKLLDPSSIKEEATPKASPPPQIETPVPAASQDEKATPSSPGTPAPPGPAATPASMAPPADKKKGVKRTATAANKDDPSAKMRGKPGPKKRAKMDDGTNDAVRGSTYHKLGPKANQGAINAGLRALDRSGAPCRKWSKGGFKLKSFTGVPWEIPRWTAPPKPKPEAAAPETTESADSSNKENKEGSQQVKSDDNSASNAGGEQRSIPPSIQASSPAPIPIAAA